MGVLSKIFSGGATELVKTVGGVIDNLTTSKEEKELAKLELQKEINRNIEALQIASLKEIELQNAEMNSARNREILIATSEKAPLLNKIQTPILALFITAGFFGLLAYMLKHDVPASNKDILNVMLGSLGTAWITVVGYFFGSSQGSRNKEETIKKLMK